MIDSTRKGLRCRTKRMIRSHAGILGSSSPGTIAHELDNLGRQLILVQWDAGICTYVSPEQIELVVTEEPTAGSSALAAEACVSPTTL